MIGSGSFLRCRECGCETRADAAYCTHCGSAIISDHDELSFVDPMTIETVPSIAGGVLSSARDSPKARRRLITSGAGVVALGFFLLALTALLRTNEERSLRAQEALLFRQRNQVLTRQINDLRADLASLNGRVEMTDTRAKQGLAPLAQRILHSVYTIETSEGSGSAWSAWKSNGSTYLITANHVTAGERTVKVKQKTSTWRGRVVKSDEVNDISVVRVDRNLGPALWSDGSKQARPTVGETVILLGSPYGLEGTVTTGVVSRVTYNRIQTDAAANPGNSGGPAVDADGNIVGILVSGGGENINFAIPIQRACVTIRNCASGE